MKYLCLIYGDESRWATYSKEQAESELSEYMAFTDDVRKSGHMLGGDALQATSTATTVRVRNGKVSTTDGPFAETKDQLGGYYLVDVPDNDEAVRWAAQCPGAKHGACEVRPLNPTPE